MRNVLVTGSEGFIGHEISQKLNSAEFRVWKIDKHVSAHSIYELDIDITSKEDLQKISNVSFEVIIHCAAQTDVRASVEDPLADLYTNGIGTLNLVEFAVSNQVKNFIYINSGGAIYGTDEFPLSEKSPVAPSSPYGLTKFLGEEYVRILCTKNRIHWSSLALSNVYGDITRNNKGVIYEFAKKLSQNQAPIIFGKKVTRDFIYIDDVIQAIVLAMSNPTFCRVNISSNVETNIEDIYTLVAREMKTSIEPVFEDPRFGEILRSRLENSLAKECLGWAPTVSITEGVAKSLSNFDLEQ